MLTCPLSLADAEHDEFAPKPQERVASASPAELCALLQRDLSLTLLVPWPGQLVTFTPMNELAGPDGSRERRVRREGPPAPRAAVRKVG